VRRILGLALACAAMSTARADSAVKIQPAHATAREIQTKTMLERVLADYDLKRYLFTKTVVIEERAINHAFPVLTLNARFADSEDELLASFIHEQLHWHLREGAGMSDAVATLRRWYPRVPIGGREGAETEYSTYGHLIDCFLEVQAVRQLIGPERTTRVIEDKGHYTWIYKTVLTDEARIAGLVRQYRLDVNN